MRTPLHRSFHLLIIKHRLLRMTLLFAATQVSAQLSPSLSEIRTTLQEPVTILLDSGNQQTGRVTYWDDSELRIEVSLGGGTAELTFPANEIRSIRFPGGEFKHTLNEWKKDPDRVEEALALYRAYYQQQGAYLSLLNQRELSFFIDYADFALAQKEPLKAVATIDVISPYIEDEAVLKQLKENLLLGFFQGGMRKEAEVEARRAQCLQCIKLANGDTVQRPYGTQLLPERAGEIMMMDYFLIWPSRQGNKYVLLQADKMAKQAELSVTKEAAAVPACQAMLWQTPPPLPWP